MSPDPADVVRRIRYRFGGQCQGVGFRYNIEHICAELGISGWVRNEYDGTVTAELQTTSPKLALFIGKLQQTYERWHVDWRIVEADDIEPVEGEGGFRIRY